MTEDLNTTKNRLLDAAEELFADRPYDEVSIRELAAAAEVNVAAVNYHFQGKENLFNEVILRRFVGQRQKTVAALEKVAAQDRPTIEEVINALVREHLQATLGDARSGTFLSLITRELMANKGHAHEVFFREMVAPVFAVFSQALMKAQPTLQQDQLNWVIASIIGQVHHFILRWKKKELLDPDSEIFAIMIQVFPAMGLPLAEYIQQATTHITRFSCAAIESLYAEVD